MRRVSQAGDPPFWIVGSDGSLGMMLRGEHINPVFKYPGWDDPWRIPKHMAAVPFVRP